MPDTNIFYHSMDIMEQANVFCDVIVLQTALDELRNKSLPLYNRLRQLVADAEKRFYVFHNEYHSETFVQRHAGETINDRNDRAIRYTSVWFKDHLAKATRGTKLSSPKIILLTDDSANRRKATDEGIPNIALKAYLGYERNANQLLDMLSAEEEIQTRRVNGETVYADYFHASRLQDGLRQGILHQGILNTSTYNFLEASCAVPAFSKPVHIIGREHLNRATQGDVVVLEILPETEWKVLQPKLLEVETVTKTDDPEEESETVVFNAKEETEAVSTTDVSNGFKSTSQRTAKVVGVAKRNWRSYVGHLDPVTTTRSTSSRGVQSVFVLPVDRRLPKIRIRTRQSSELRGQKLVVSIDRWDKSSKYPEGHFVRALGTTESKEAETEALLLEWDVQYRPFPRAVLDCLPVEGASWSVPQNMDDNRWSKREDLRDLLICSIDPPGCQDIDDALHSRLLPNGNIEAGVHIADVSSFVKADTAMDDEAASRGTTVYMVDKRIDMLPHLLGTNLCSLMPYVERFAFSTIWELSPEGKIVNVRFTKSVIKSREAFSYSQAQMRINDVNAHDELTCSMRRLLQLSKKLRSARLAAGALNLASPEVRIEMDSETSDPIDVQTKQALETNSLVEEFMLLANISVATKIHEAYPETAMLRRHGAPPATNFELLQDILLVRRNIRLQVDSSKALADSLDLCIDPAAPFFNTLVRIMATRCMLSAEYFPAGALPEDEFRHYGLASSIYTHFTSPIRRYADVIAHRQLSAAIGFEPLHPSLQNLTKLDKICDNINYRHRMAQMAGRASVEYYVGQALKGHDAIEEAYVMKTFQNGIVVFVPKFGIEGVIKTSGMSYNEIPSQFDPHKYELVLSPGSAEEQSLAIFDKVRVKVVTQLEEGTGKRKVELSLYK
ncbi:Mitotic control protein dis3 [Taphrina deformans PYCC 5710]|uniref:Ribosomal RNA-processing protein 44 n=1 Tax=Taphrina deformans (strain PYCC 5710 / ATCC 11124 / CBS 356.35 / IMI 108563 / JCM 9778 / NBRC 8474) TaxID=1097556 RepID=R4XFX0_TAPDE|nr:Mitotic control protein dis3 [Taphrina deformans PYCC 5710]|eukprot:CCG82269.1 Mitotic control protein dis3 [Taphrina deformans PYCC 5710]